MRHEFIADVNEITDGLVTDASLEPPATVHAYGLSGDEVDFSLPGAARRDAGSWYGRRVKVTIETIDGKE